MGIFKVFTIRALTLQALRQLIKTEYRSITGDMLQNVLRTLVTRFIAYVAHYSE